MRRTRISALATASLIAATALAGCSNSDQEKAKDAAANATSAAGDAASAAGSAAGKATSAAGSAAAEATSKGASAATSASDQATKPFAMPNEVGKGLQEAQDDLQKVSGNPAFPSKSKDALGKGRQQVLDRDWKVCSQTPAAGQQVKLGDTVTFNAVKNSESCPS